MIVYTSMLLSTWILGYATQKNNTNKSKKVLSKYIIFFILFLVMGLRYGIGQDYFFTYKPVFETILRNGNYNNIEFGFVLLNKIIQFFTNDYIWIFIVTSFIFVCFVLKSIYDQSVNIAMSIFIMICDCFYFYAMNVVRQSIVIAIFIYAIKYIQEKNLKKYLLFLLVASTIHKIALIFIPVYFISQIRIDKKLFVFLSVVIYTLIPFVFKILNVILFNTKYGNYLSGYYQVNEGSMISPIINLLLIVICYFISDRTIYDSKLNIYKNIHILGFWCSMFLGTIPLISRIFVNFYHVIYLTIPYIISKFSNSSTKKIMWFVCIIAFLVNFIYSIYLKNGNNVLPYNWIFNR